MGLLPALRILQLLPLPRRLLHRLRLLLLPLLLPRRLRRRRL